MGNTDPLEHNDIIEILDIERGTSPELGRMDKAHAGAPSPVSWAQGGAAAPFLKYNLF